MIGGVAAIAQGDPLTTDGLDVTPARDPESRERLTQALRDLVRMKQAAGRPRDLAQIPALVATLEGRRRRGE